MNNYIIDPAVFYWINVLGSVQTMCAVLGAFALIGAISCAAWYLYRAYYNDEPDKPEDENNRYEKQRYERQLKNYQDELKKILKVRKLTIALFIIGGVLVLVSVFMPGKQTSVEMLVAKTATFDNVNWTVQQVKEVIDYIVSALKGAV